MAAALEALPHSAGGRRHTMNSESVRAAVTPVTLTKAGSAKCCRIEKTCFMASTK